MKKTWTDKIFYNSITLYLSRSLWVMAPTPHHCSTPATPTVFFFLMGSTLARSLSSSAVFIGSN